MGLSLDKGVGKDVPEKSPELEATEPTI